jgi:hypothetical protein
MNYFVYYVIVQESLVWRYLVDDDDDDDDDDDAVAVAVAVAVAADADAATAATAATTPVLFLRTSHH